MKTDLVKVQACEFEAVFSYYKQGLSHHLDAVFGWDDVDQRQRLESNYEWEWFYWIVENTERLGLLCFKLYDNSYHMHLLIIAPEFQGRGVGAHVIEGLHARARQEKRHSITLNCFVRNTGAAALYQRLGYRIVNEDQGVYSLVYELSSET